MKIISGGQSGVDRAALDFAIECGFECSGWCPKGRLAEDGIIPEKYPLIETESADYNERTRLNVENSDGTLIIFQNEKDTGTNYTIEVLKELKKPYLILKTTDVGITKNVTDWLGKNKIDVLNVAGPRESNSRGIYNQTKIILKEVFAKQY